MEHALKVLFGIITQDEKCEIHGAVIIYICNEIYFSNKYE